MNNKTRKRVLVTGASVGIGRCMAEQLAADGHDLILVSRSGDALARLAQEWSTRHGVEVLPMPADLSQTSEIQRLCDDIERRQLAIDVLINNAGVGVWGDFIETEWEREDQLLRLNVDGVVLLTKRLLPNLISQRGRILNIASLAAFLPGPGFALYHASKAFVKSFSESLAAEVAPRGVSVTVFCPGPVHTEFQSRAKMQDSKLFRQFVKQPEDVARMALRAMWRGQRVATDGIVTWVSGYVGRMLPSRSIAAIVRGRLGRRSR